MPPVTRRTFLHSASALAAAPPVPGPRLGPEGVTPPDWLLGVTRMAFITPGAGRLAGSAGGDERHARDAEEPVGRRDSFGAQTRAGDRRRCREGAGAVEEGAARDRRHGWLLPFRALARQPVWREGNFPVTLSARE